MLYLYNCILYSQTTSAEEQEIIENPGKVIIIEVLRDTENPAEMDKKIYVNENISVRSLHLLIMILVYNYLLKQIC